MRICTAKIPAAARNPLLSSPWYIKAPLAIFGLVAVLRILKAISNRDRGSLDTLQGRGLISEERSMANTDPFYDKVMKNVRTVQYEELSDDQIKAARMRRSRDRDFTKVDLEKVELPANHPFAMKKQVSRDEEKLQKARLEIKRGLPLQDLANNRGFPDSPRMQPQGDGRQQAARVPSRNPPDKPQPHQIQPPTQARDATQ
ncbi:g4471 [Coccomyxa viridis]|uniref:G4471 protein n=1 Tax=Coccomyxa viridis TaxID=1274662 RepID=A0ABP1FVD6_9CHLO